MPSSLLGAFLCSGTHGWGINTAVSICFSTQNSKILFQGVERDGAVLSAEQPLSFRLGTQPFVCLADMVAHLLNFCC